jgi:hypothetical protein
MTVRAPVLTSPIFCITAEGVRGGVRRRRERVVVCERRRVVVAFIVSGGFGVGVVGVGEEGVEVRADREEAVREDWKCVRRFWEVLVRVMRDCRSAGGFVGLDFGGIVVSGCSPRLLVGWIWILECCGGVERGEQFVRNSGGVAVVGDFCGGVLRIKAGWNELSGAGDALPHENVFPCSHFFTTQTTYHD